MATPGPTPDRRRGHNKSQPLKAMHKLAGKKTYLVALAGALTAWASFFNGAIPLADAVEATFTAVITATLRHGISTGA